MNAHHNYCTFLITELILIAQQLSRVKGLQSLIVALVYISIYTVVKKFDVAVNLYMDQDKNAVT